MSTEPTIPYETYLRIQDYIRIGRRAVHEAQEQNRRRGIPNVYSINGFLYYELPNGELSREDPWVEPPDDQGGEPPA